MRPELAELRALIERPEEVAGEHATAAAIRAALASSPAPGEDPAARDERRSEERRREFLLTAMPEQLQLKSGAAMEERARGLHKVNTYKLKTHIQAQWAPLASLQPQTTVKGSRMQCGAPILMLGVGDARGIRTAQLTLGGQTLALKPGTFHPQYSRGLHATLPESVLSATDGLAATLDLELVGTERLSIVPLGSNTEVQLSSGWPHPSFTGRFLPSEREVRDDGFTAQWRLSSLATTAQQDIAQGKPVCQASGGDDEPAAAAAPSGGCADSFSVAFIDPVNPYSLAQRAIKYGVLFIALTFVGVGLFELMKRLRVHPVQYLLVGSALCSFFLLLVSQSTCRSAPPMRWQPRPACCCWATTPATCWAACAGACPLVRAWRCSTACCMCCCNWSRRHWSWAHWRCLPCWPW